MACPPQGWLVRLRRGLSASGVACPPQVWLARLVVLKTLLNGVDHTPHPPIKKYHITFLLYLMYIQILNRLTAYRIHVFYIALLYIPDIFMYNLGYLYFCLKPVVGKTTFGVNQTAVRPLYRVEASSNILV